MTQTYLLKLGELTLKGGNRAYFEHVLRGNLTALLKGSGASINTADGRMYVRCDESAETLVEDALNRLAGITGWAKAQKTEKTEDAVIAAAAREARLCFEAGARTFKVEARRTDKSFPLSSYMLCCAAGDAIRAANPGFTVDLRNPGAVISIEIREKAYIYGFEHKGLRGLPPGTAGRGLLLLSGGIDSPVAGYLMALRGMRFQAVYYHAFPYTPDEAREKVITLARRVGRYSMGVKLHVVGFTRVEQAIKAGAPEEWLTLLLRMAMMDCANTLAKSARCKCLITGESLSQVASQTVENIACSESRSSLPVMRPLIGMDKEAIIGIARAIGTYETSVLPFMDCCALFSPPHPVIRARRDEAVGRYEALNIGPLIEEALHDKTVEKC